MTAAGGFRVEGLTKLTRDLQRLGLEVEDLKDAFAKIAAEGAELAAGYAPRKTGRLAASIRGNRAKSKAVVAAGGARVPYAGAINYGWGTEAANYKHGKYASGMSGAFAGSKFMQRADEDLGPRALEALEASINAKIRSKGLG